MLEPEVVVQVAGEMFLDAEETIGCLDGGFADGVRRAGRFRGLLEVAFLFVLL